jgi:hypothetical protein
MRQAPGATKKRRDQMNKMTKKQATNIGRSNLKDAITKEQAVEAMISIAWGTGGREYVSPIGRARGISAAIARLTQPVAYKIARIAPRSAEQMWIVLQQADVVRL